MLAATLIFIIATVIYKDSDIMKIDVADAIAFAVISFTLNLFLSMTNARGCYAHITGA